MFKPIGPCVLALGDPTVALGAGMTSLGDIENVSVDLGVRNAYTSSARRNGTPVSDGLYMLAPQPRVQVEMTDAALSILQEIVLNAVSTTAVSETALGFGDEFALLTTIPSLCILPVQQLADLEAADNAIWFPATTIAGVNGIQFGRVDEGEIQQPYNVEFQAAYRDTDQAATAIPAGYRIAWMGSPLALGLPWSLPAGL